MTGAQPWAASAAMRYGAALAALAVAIALVPLVAAANAQEPDPNDVTAERLAGANRFGTARLIAADAFPDADTVVVASGQQFPDALAGSYLAGLFEAPVLLVARTTLPEDTLMAMADLDVQEVVLLGGAGAVSAEVEAAIDAEHEVVDRFSGATRFETAADIALAADEVGTWEDEATAILATGEAFADALVSGPVAYSEGFPVLLTPTAELHPAAEGALTDLGIERVIIPGGEAAVSADVEDAVADHGIAVTRVWGASRFDTSVAFAEFAATQFGYSYEELNVATGFDFADALAMGPRAGRNGNPLLLTNGTQTTAVDGIQAFLRDNACEILSLAVAGGSAAVSEQNLRSLVEAASACDVDFTVALDWRNEVDPDAQGPVGLEDPSGFGFGQEGASGTAELDLTEDGLTFQLVVEGLASPPRPVTGSPAHIHVGEIDENGPIVVVLGSAEDFSYDEDEQTLTGSGEGIVDPEDEDVLDDLLANPSAYYVNIHSEAYPSGAVRGQLPDGGQALLPEGIVAPPGEAYSAALDWRNEVDPDAEGPVGLEDPLGFGYGQEGAAGTIELDITEDGATFDLVVEGLDSPPAVVAGSPAHIHVGAIDDNGPVVVVLGSADDFTYDPDEQTLTGSGEGVVNTGVDEGIFAEILADPSGYYVNVHSEAYPSGAVRGQLPDGGQDLLPEGILPQP